MKYEVINFGIKRDPKTINLGFFVRTQKNKFTQNFEKMPKCFHLDICYLEIYGIKYSYQLDENYDLKIITLSLRTHIFALKIPKLTLESKSDATSRTLFFYPRSKLEFVSNHGFDN
jgi:hypothetical protein